MRFYYPLDKGYINKDNIPYNGNFNSPRKYGDGSYRGHDGIDYLAPIGPDIYSAGSGKVIFSNYVVKGYGNTIVIRHADGTSTLYAHMKELSDYKKDDWVNGRIKIGKTGDTGNAKGEEPHLHFEHIDKKGSDMVEFGNGKNLGLNMHEHRLNPHDSMEKMGKYFVWHAGGEACDECQKRDGKIFEYGVDEEPPLHPNCECTTEDIEVSDEKKYCIKSYNFIHEKYSLFLKYFGVNIRDMNPSEDCELFEKFTKIIIC